MKKSLLTLALFSAFFLPIIVRAETPLELVIVTPTRFEAASDDSAVDVTVITADDIAKSAATTLPALLGQHAGIHVRSNDGTPDMAIDMRGFGMSGNQNTLVLLDGQPLNDIELTSIRWTAIPLASIERIEIVNGSGTVLFGGGATGGTLNIITKHPGKSAHKSAGVGVGTYDTRQWKVALSGSNDSVGMRVTASGLDTANYRANNNNDQKNLEADLRTIDAQPAITLKFGADTQHLRFPGARTVNPTAGVNELNSDPRGTSTPLDYGNSDGAHASLGLAHTLDSGSLAAELSFRNTKRRAYYDYYCDCGGDDVDTALKLISFTPRTIIPGDIIGYRNEVVFGADFSHWDYDSRRLGSGFLTAHILATQSNRAIYAQDAIQLGQDTKITVGARTQLVNYEANDTANPEPYASSSKTHRINAFELGFRQDLNQHLSLFGRAGRSFRVATVDETFGNRGAPTYDSIITILRPQISQDSEIGISRHTESYNFRAALFQMYINDEIHFNSLVGALGTNVNLSPTRRYGLELEGRHTVTEAVEVDATYSYTVAKFREGIYGGINVSGNNIPLVPRHNFSMSSSWKVSEKSTLNSSLLYTGKQYLDNDQANTFGAMLPAYATMNMKYSRRDGSWLLTIAADNMLDRHYVTYGVASTSTPGKYNAYPMQGRNISLNAAYDF